MELFGPTAAGYRLSAYRCLPVGWSPAPPDVWSDLHMWRKFLQRHDLSFGTCFTVQSAKLAAGFRQHMTLEERAHEHRAVAAQLSTSEERSNFQARAFQFIYRALADTGNSTQEAAT